MATNTTNRAQIIPCNWICDECPHSRKYNQWDYRCACTAQFTEDDGHAIALFEDDSTPICARVASAGFVTRRCDDDDELHFRDDYGHADDGNYYSADYCRCNFYQCSECGEWITDYYNYDRDLQMCNDCADYYRREQYKLIGGWHEHKGTFEIVGDWFDPYTVGVEIEVEGYGVDHEDTAHLIEDKFPNTFVYEWDCSLYDGFEIISQPHTLRAFDALDLEKLEKLLVSEGYEETDEDRSTGLHVHYSTAFLGDTNEEKTTTLARLIRFYDCNFDLLCDLVERKDLEHSCRNCDRYDNDCEDYDDDYELVRSQVDGSRYVAVNCNRFYRGTFEVRLCDGTIRADKIRAWVDFNIAVMQCLQEHDTTDMRAVVPYMSDRCINFFGEM